MSDQALIPSKLATAHALRTKIAQLQTEHDTLTGWRAAHHSRDRSLEKSTDADALAARATYLNEQIASTATALADAKDRLSQAVSLEPVTGYEVPQASIYNPSPHLPKGFGF